MKKFYKTYQLIIFLIFFLAPSILYSQIISSYGIKGGAVFAKSKYDYTNNYIFETKFRTGIDAAIFIEIFKHQFFSGLAEIHYIQKGFKLEIPVTTEQNPEGNGQYFYFYPRIDYLSIPLLFKVRKDFKSFSPYAFAGPRFEIKIGHNNDYGNSKYSAMNSFDFGASMGLGAQYHVSKKLSVLLEGRYSYPITSSLSNSVVTIKNYSFEILGGVSFDISKK